jgi:flagellar biosynthesis/type III secretory pathway protein FliH
MRFIASLPDLSLPPPAGSPPPPPDPALLAMVRAEGATEGHARGFAEGLAEGHRRQATMQNGQIAASLSLLAATLADSTTEAERLAMESAEALASLLLSVLDAALPEESARRGAALPARIAAALRPALADRPEARLFVAPELVAPAVALLPTGPEVAADPTLAPGDGRIEWRDGAHLVSLEARRAAVRAALEAAGFIFWSEEP